MRRPYRERLKIILDELGAGVGGRASDIQATVRRAVPALRETDEVLAILADQNKTLANLTHDADAVIGDLAANRKNVGRFVTETHQTARASAERRAQIGASLQRLPAFLAELAADDGQARPGDRRAVARARRPQRLLGPARDAAAEPARLRRRQPHRLQVARRAQPRRPAGPAQRQADDRRAVEVRRARRRSWRTTSRSSSRTSTTASRAVEKDPRSPGGQGYTGFEALLQYVYDQSMAINAFDSNGYMLKVNLFASECSDYQNLQSLKEKLKKDPGFYARCAAILGPHQPGITQPDPTLHRRAGGPREGPGRPPRRSSRPARRTSAEGARRPHRSDRAERRRPQGQEQARDREGPPQGREAQAAARGHARHPAPRPARRPRRCRRCRACRPPRRALPTRSSSWTSCSRHEARVQPDPDRRRHRAGDDRRRVPGLQRQQRPAVRADRDGQGARGQRREPDQGQRGAQRRHARRRRHRHAPGPARRRDDRRRGHDGARQGARQRPEGLDRADPPALGARRQVRRAHPRPQPRHVPQRRRDAAVAGLLLDRARRGLQDVRRQDAHRRRRRTCAASATRSPAAARTSAARSRSCRRCCSRSSR